MFENLTGLFFEMHQYPIKVKIESLFIDVAAYWAYQTLLFMCICHGAISNEQRQDSCYKTNELVKLLVDIS